MTRFLTVPVASAVVRFLLDRLDEDYDEVDHLGRARRVGPAVRRGAGTQARQRGANDLRSVERLRAEIVAKRHVIGDLQQLLILRDQGFEAPIRASAAAALHAMAAPYANHPRFRAEWLPAEDHVT